MRKWRKSCTNQPNKLEAAFQEVMDKVFPNEWKFVGDGEVIIAGKCPDFININGKKLLIELFGDYWHRGDIPEDRIAIFTPHGYDTLVIWEGEFKKSQNTVIEKVSKFMRQGVLDEK